MHEELGVKVEIMDRLPIYKNFFLDDFYLDYVTFICKLTNSIPDKHESEEEHTEVLDSLWMSKECMQLDYKNNYHIKPQIHEIITILEGKDLL